MKVKMLTFSRELRLLAPVQFKAVFENPFRASTPQMTLLARLNTAENPRLGLTVAGIFSLKTARTTKYGFCFRSERGDWQVG